MLAGSGLAAKALGHSHATCRSGLALNYYAYRQRNSFSWKRRHSQSGSLENETIASIVIDPRVEPWIYSCVADGCQAR